jgi:hypothetical protein
MPAPKARTRHTLLTTEAFRELAESAIEELCENSATLDMQTLQDWQKDLKRTIGAVSDHQTSTDPLPFGRVGEGFSDV